MSRTIEIATIDICARWEELEEGWRLLQFIDIHLTAAVIVNAMTQE